MFTLRKEFRKGKMCRQGEKRYRKQTFSKGERSSTKSWTGPEFKRDFYYCCHEKPYFSLVHNFHIGVVNKINHTEMVYCLWLFSSACLTVKITAHHYLLCDLYMYAVEKNTH